MIGAYSPNLMNAGKLSALKVAGGDHIRFRRVSVPYFMFYVADPSVVADQSGKFNRKQQEIAGK